MRETGDFAILQDINVNIQIQNDTETMFCDMFANKCIPLVAMCVEGLSGSALRKCSCTCKYLYTNVSDCTQIFTSCKESNA